VGGPLALQERKERGKGGRKLLFREPPSQIESIGDKSTALFKQECRKKINARTQHQWRKKNLTRGKQTNQEVRPTWGPDAISRDAEKLLTEGMCGKKKPLKGE